MLSTAAVVQRRLGPNDPSSTTRPVRAWDCNRETLAQIKLVHDSGGAPDAQFTPGQVLPGPDPAQPIPGQVKQQALAAVSSLETRTQIRLVKNTGSPVPATRRRTRRNGVPKKLPK